MTVNVAGWNNERGLVVIEIPPVYRGLYDLSSVEWIQQVRDKAGDPTLRAEARSSADTALWSDAAGTITFVYPLSTTAELAGNYVHDYGFVPPGGDFVRVDGGAFSIQKGVTR